MSNGANFATSRNNGPASRIAISIFAHAQIKALSLSPLPLTLSLSLSLLFHDVGCRRVYKAEGTRRSVVYRSEFRSAPVRRGCTGQGTTTSGTFSKHRRNTRGRRAVSCPRETSTNRTSPTWISIYTRYLCFFVLSNAEIQQQHPLDTIRDYFSQVSRLS